MWGASLKAWIIRQLLMEWLHEVSMSNIKKRLPDISCVIGASNGQHPAHPPSLVDNMEAGNDFMKVKFLPTNGYLFCSRGPASDLQLQ